MNIKKYVLKNGLRVVLTPMKDTQTVTVAILVEAGSKYESKRNNGVSHFLEHMMFKGTKKRPKAKIISEQLDGIGADYNAFTGKEQTGYWIKSPKNKFNLALDVVSDMYLNPLLEQREIDVERGVILQEVAMYQDTPTRRIFDIFEDLLYGDQPAGWEIIGTQKNIKGLNREDFVAYIKQHYQPQNTVISVAGNFDEKKTFEKIEKVFSPIKKGKRTVKKATIQKQNVPKIKIFNKKTEQTHLMLGVRSGDMFSEERYSLAVLGAVLGGGMSSRMFSNIREKHGLTYYIGSASEQMTDSGYFFVNAGVEHANLEKTVKLIIEELKKIKNKKISKRELKKAVDHLKGGTLMGLESSSAVASFFGDQELFRKEVKPPEALFERIEKITENDIIRLARKIFINKGLNLAIIGPHNNESNLKRILTF